MLILKFKEIFFFIKFIINIKCFYRRDFIFILYEYFVLNCIFFFIFSLNYSNEFKSGIFWDYCYSFDGFINKS